MSDYIPKSTYIPTENEVETAFHEFASELEFNFPGKYPEAPEFAYGPEALYGFRRWLAQERAKAQAEALREAITEFAKQHGLGDLESRPLYDAQQQLADAKSEIERLRVVERELDGQRLELAAAWETTCEAVGVDTDSTLGEWQTAFDERVAHYHASGYKAGKRDALEEAAEAFNAELGSNAANPGPKYVVGWLHNRAAKLGAK